MQARSIRRLAILTPLALLGACAGLPPARPPGPEGTTARPPVSDRAGARGSEGTRATALPPALAAPTAPLRPGPRGGAFYKDDGPGEGPPFDLDGVPDAQPKWEPLHRFANRPYVVFGREYTPATSLRPYRERGLASWYGRKFHGQPTSTGETYDMYAMTAAHPTLPLPSYARVDNPGNGRSVIVRINDRGPFHPGRIIDLSYTAAHRLGILERGSGEVEVHSILFALDELLAGLPELAATDAGTIQLPVRADPAGVFVQLGAFGNSANAETFRTQVANQIAAAEIELTVRQAQGVFRVLAGPFADRTVAGRASERIRAAIGVEGTIRSQ